MVTAGADPLLYDTVFTVFLPKVISVDDHTADPDDQKKEQQKDIDDILLCSEAGQEFLRPLFR